MKWIARLLGSTPPKIQTFTYYIPAPPARKTGYREREFDSLFYEFINRGYKVLSFQAVPHTGVNQCGMWLVFVVESTNAAAAPLVLDPDLAHDPLAEKIEGLYPIDHDSH